MTAVLQTDGLGKQYGRRWALRDCTLSIPAGKVVGLVGPNGAGKTTLLQLAVGLLEPTSGTIEVLDGRPAESSAQLGRVGFVAPGHADLRNAFGRRPSAARRLAQPRLEQRAGRAAGSSSSASIPRQRAGKLSGGQRAQLALTLAIAKRPELLILDEPVASLDPVARRDFLRGLMEVVAEHGVSVVLSSHLVADLERVCDYLVVLVDSRVQVAGEIDQLLASHHRLVGPRRDPSTLPANQEVIEAIHADRQSTLIVRTDEPDPRPGLDRRAAQHGRPRARLHGPSRAHQRRSSRPGAGGGSAVIRFAWRQFRTQAVVAFATLAALAILLAITGAQLEHRYDTSGIASCKPPSNCDALKSAFLLSYGKPPHLLGALLLVVPALLGIFWGAPLVARELEAGTYRLAWTQSVTRTRWFAVKVALIGLASIAVAGLLSLMVTWWSSPLDHLNMNRFTPGVFDERGIVPIGYAAFALALGLTAGTLIRRTVPAMAATLVTFVGARLAVTYWIRPHLMTPAHTSATFASASNLGFEVDGASGVTFVAGPPQHPKRLGLLEPNRRPSRPYRQASLHTFLLRACPKIADTPGNPARRGLEAVSAIPPPSTPASGSCPPSSTKP